MAAKNFFLEKNLFAIKNNTYLTKLLMDWKYEYGNNEENNTLFNHVWPQTAEIVIVKTVKLIRFTILTMLRRL